MESNYLTQKLSFISEEEPNFSELHMAWFVYRDPATGHSFIGKPNFGSESNPHPTFDIGGNASRSIAYLSRMTGPVDESKLSYTTENAIAISEDTTPKKPEDYFPLSLRLKETYSLGNVDDNNREAMKPIIKRMIMGKGGVQISYYASGGASSATGRLSYFDNSKGTTTDHSVMAVGWNDNYSRENFSTEES